MYTAVETKVIFLLVLKRLLKYIVRHDTCQLMVVGINSTKQGSPVWGVIRKETLFSANSSAAIQHSCENNMAAKQLNNVTAQL